MGADRIYAGQMAVLGKKPIGATIQVCFILNYKYGIIKFISTFINPSTFNYLKAYVGSRKRSFQEICTIDTQISC